MKGKLLTILGLCLFAHSAFALGPIDTPYPGRDAEETTMLWTSSNVHGVSDITEFGEDANTNIEYRFVSSVSNNVTIDINSRADSWSVRDSIDSLSFRKTPTGYVLTRRKLGYAGVNTVTFDTNGNKVSETSTLTAPISDSFADGLQRLQQHYNLDAVAASSGRQVGGGGFSCKAGMVLGGLAIVGESIGYGLAWASGGIGGIAATPVYILAVHSTNAWVLSNCGF